MADPICRWRNPSVKQVVEFNGLFPLSITNRESARALVEKRCSMVGIKDFFTTPYQLAAQMGMYYEDDALMYPRFNSLISYEKALDYMFMWGKKYYAPNPYTKSMSYEQKPVIINNFLVNWVFEHETALWSEALDAMFDDTIGNTDILVNMINNFTEVSITDNILSLKQNAPQEAYSTIYADVDPKDKKAFFEYFGGINVCGDETPLDDANVKGLQKIFYGAPGTGKSNTIKGKTKLAEEEGRVFRTTFHPDSDYSTFVGCYKPTTKNCSNQSLLDYDSLVDRFKKYISDLGNITHASAAIGYNYHDSIVKMQEGGVHSIADLLADAHKSGTTYDTTIRSGMLLYEEQVQLGRVNSKITYEFVAQAFTNAYVKAWNTTDDVYLIIEEINRGNCAQIFGDLFQLLDRKNGESEYPVDADTDLANYLHIQLANTSRTDIPKEVKNGKKLKLPSNLYVWATMNTSDQSLFPIDSAFKRRWDWKYLKIKEGKDKNGNKLDWVIDVNLKDENGEERPVKWWTFIKKINEIIASMTSSADKQLGYFFCKADKKQNENDQDATIISEDAFVGKVLFYLWNDVFKDYGFEDATLFRYKSKEEDEEKESDKDLTFPDFYDEEGEKVNSLRVTDFVQKVMNWKKNNEENS